MKVLIVGNSQAASLKIAHDRLPDVLGKLAEISFYITPGGTGPYLSIKNDTLVVNKGEINPKFPPRVHPEEATRIPVSHYDAIVISALGLVDCGFYYPYPITRQGLLYDFFPKDNEITNRWLSKTCYEHVINQSLAAQPGIKFLMQLRQSYSRQIIVQPIPLISDAIRDHPGWTLNHLYDNPLGAHEFFCMTRDTFMQRLCLELSAELLPYPREEWRVNYFTPAEFMNSTDGLHTDERYGRMVIQQLEKCLLAPEPFLQSSTSSRRVNE